MADKLYRIRPLVWKDVWVRKELPPEQQAETMFGYIYAYRLGEAKDGKFRATCLKVIGSDYPTLEAAKAACMAWYVERLEAALENASGTDEPTTVETSGSC